MAKKTYIYDFGGNSYGQTPRKTERSNKDLTHSFRCLDCNTIRYLTQREITRAAIQHCLSCGGALEETSDSKERHIRKSDAARVARMGGHIADHELESPEKCVCKSCDTKWTDANALMYHVTKSDSCLSAYASSSKIVVAEGSPFLSETLHIFQMSNIENEVVGITAAGKLKTIKTFKSIRDARALIRDLKTSNADYQKLPDGNSKEKTN